MGGFSIPARDKPGAALEDSVVYAGREISYCITYSRKRKTVAIVLHGPDHVEVKAPAGFGLPSIRNLVLLKSPWILKKTAVMRHSGHNTIARNYSSGELFHYLGNPLTLDIIRDSTVPPVTANGSVLTVSIPGEVTDQELGDHVKKRVLAWYRERARLVIGDRVAYFSAVLGIPAPGFRVRNIRRRWGSCSGDDQLSFNIRLVMAPGHQIDYVVLHELCHINHKDHQEKFWSAVAKFMPDYQGRKDLLKQEGFQYVL